jgi:hypothetical protein
MRKSFVGICAGLIVVVAAAQSYAGPSGSKPQKKEYEVCQKNARKNLISA